jgi:hypothetical protein
MAYISALVQKEHIMRRRLALLITVPAILSLSGCYISKSSNKDGAKDNVAIETPLGGMHIKTDSLKAIDVGLPEYPGAVRVAKRGHNNESADINMSFGSFQLHVKAMEYQSRDPQDKIIDFYKKALSRYGDVLECRNHQAVGKVTRTSDGLTCENDSKRGSVHTGESGASLELKAGSKQHQHIVGIEPTDASGTKFGLVSLDLPHGAEGGESS